MTLLFQLHAFVLFQMISHAHLQAIQGRHIRPYPSKCENSERCQIGVEADNAYLKSENEKDRNSDPTRDSWHRPAERPETSSYHKPSRQDYDSHKTPFVDDYHVGVVKPPDHGYISKPPVETINKPKFEPSGGGYHVSEGGYNNKPSQERPGTYRDEHTPKPVRNDGGYYPRPPTDDKDDYGSISSGGKGDESYHPRPVGDRDNRNPKPVSDKDIFNHRPGYRPDEGTHNPKPSGVDEGYHPRPTDHRGDYDLKPPNRGVYNPRPGHISKPKDDGGHYPKPDDEELNDKDENPYKKDMGGYHRPKDDDYNEDFGTGGGIMDDEDITGGRPIPIKEGNCICVPYYQCQDGHIVTDGAGIIDARKKTYPEEELPLDGKFKPTSCGPYHVCCNSPESSTVRPYVHRCGSRNPSGINSRILSPGQHGEADFGEWPWQAAILKAEGKANIFQCGGVLIDKFHVLTVAHCVFHLYKYNSYPLKVRLGEWDTQTTTEFLAHEDYGVSKIMVHPDYRNTSLWNDVAILRLEEAVEFAPHIDTVCLPQHDEVFAGQNCVVTGWGKDAYKGGTFSNIMKEVALQVIDDYKCEEMLRKTRLGRFFQLHEGFLCAGGEYGVDSCKGDGGGPLVCHRKDRSYALAGIVSWGIDCGEVGVPGVYVKIRKYLDWISKSTDTSLHEYWSKRD